MHQQTSPASQMQLAAHSRAEHHREFQALAFVDGHNAHQVLILAQHLGGALVPAGFLLRQLLQEPGQGVPTVLLELRAPLAEHPQIGLTQLALGQRTAGRIEARLPHQVPQEVRQPHDLRHESPFCQCFT